MSTNGEALIRAVTARFVKFCVQYSTITLLYFDYAITFPREVRLVWRSRFRFSTLLYICCRYALVANVLYLLIIVNTLEPTQCHVVAKLISSLSVLGRTSVIVTFTARTWAVWGSSKLILLFLGSIGTACIILDIIHVTHVKCGGDTETPFINALFVTLMCIFEFCSAILTIIRCYIAIHVRGKGIFRGQGFFHLLLEQGALYFLFTSLFTVAATVFSHNAPPDNFFQRLLNALVLPLSGFLTARFLLHLRSWEARIHYSDASYTTDCADQHQTSASGYDQEEQSELSLIEFSSRETKLANTHSEFGEDLVEVVRTAGTS